jgi:hypothetical protein
MTQEAERYRVLFNLYGPSEIEVDRVGLMGVLRAKGLPVDEIVGEVEETGSARRSVPYTVGNGSVIITKM